MIYFANPSSPRTRAAMAAGVLGQMVTPEQGNKVVTGTRWVLDNGCFSGRWTPDRYYDTVDRLAGVPGCVFAVVPDVVADAAGTNRMWGRWHLGLVRRGYPTAYVLQDGAREIPRWCEAVFVGGSTEFKLGDVARRLVALAKRHRKWVHMGRVNSRARLQYAQAIGCDSVDGTYLTFGPDQNLPRLLGWLREIDQQPPLFAGVGHA